MTKEQAIKFIEANPQVNDIFTKLENRTATIDFIRSIQWQNKKRTNNYFKDILNDILFLLTRYTND